MHKSLLSRSFAFFHNLSWSMRFLEKLLILLYTKIGLHILQIFLERNLPFFVILQEITNVLDPFSYHSLNLQKIRKKLLASVLYWLALYFARNLEQKVLHFLLLFLRDHLCIVIFLYFFSDIIALIFDIFIFPSILNEKASSRCRFRRSFLKLEWQKFFAFFKATFFTVIGFIYQQFFLFLMILLVTHCSTFDEYNLAIYEEAHKNMKQEQMDGIVLESVKKTLKTFLFEQYRYMHYDIFAYPKYSTKHQHTRSSNESLQQQIIRSASSFGTVVLLFA